MKPKLAAIPQTENHPAGIRQINIVLPLPGIIFYSETVANLYFIYFPIANLLYPMDSGDFKYTTYNHG
jgi:hypothetical protein